ncbi:MAG TPA: PIG-L deacetylase family protein [Candidatus Limnocylindrales bacterium]|nr:PIG-L deacetylase family protein [Candidatus Limnocylindrales bacterium]
MSVAQAVSASESAAAKSPHDDRPDRVLVIVAHPDDADFGVAGTLSRWVNAGSVARLVCCTSGDAGADDATTDPLELARLRESEQRAAAAVVGYEGVDFLHRPDGALENDLALREQLVRIIRSFRPDAVVAMDPTVIVHESGFIQHIDHRNAGLAAVDAVYPAARNAMAFPRLVIDEGLEPHSVNRMYLFFADGANAWVDITDTLENKLAALREHSSQLRKPEELEGWIRGWATEAGKEIGVDAAEAFRVIDLH